MVDGQRGLEGVKVFDSLEGRKWHRALGRGDGVADGQRLLVHLREGGVVDLVEERVVQLMIELVVEQVHVGDERRSC